MLNQLERRFQRFAVPRLAAFLSVGQLLVWVLGQAQPQRLQNLSLVVDDVVDGQYWRLISFLFLPPGLGVLSLFGLYLFNLMGTALEAQWGDFRFNLFVFVAWLATLATACGWPDLPATNVFIGGSVFLAFAHLFPDFEIAIMFVLPVKVRWIAMFTWIGFAWEIAFGDWMTKFMVCSGVANYFLFFGLEILQHARHSQRRMEHAAGQLALSRQAFHTCSVCGATERDNPQLEFRFCSKCDGNHEYCDQHLRTHEHVAPATRDA